MGSTQDQVDVGCRRILIWLGIIAATFAVCVAIGVAFFAINIRDYGSKTVRDDLFPLIESAQMPEDEKIALRVRVDNLIKAYRDEGMPQDDFIAESLLVREELLARQPAAPVDPGVGVPSNPPPP